MALKEHNVRPVREIFQLAEDIGPDNVMLNDGELSAVVYGEQSPKSYKTIAKDRSDGTLNIPFLRGKYSQALYRLSDAIAYRDKKLRKQA